MPLMVRVEGPSAFAPGAGEAAFARGDFAERIAECRIAPVGTITFDSPKILLGRGEGCEVRLPDPSVSHRHASIRQRGAEYVIVDEASSNGTRLQRVVDGVRVVTLLTPHAAYPLQAGDRVRVGRLWLEIERPNQMPTGRAQEAAKDIALDLTIEALSRDGEDGRPLITVESGPDAGAEKRVDGLGEVVFGRSKEADMMLTDPDVSRRHIQIRRKGDLLVVQDLGSKAGSSLGDQPLRETPQIWRAGTALSFGNTVLNYRFDAVPVLLEIERMPDERVPPSELWPEPEPEARSKADDSCDDRTDASDDIEGVSEALSEARDKAMESDTRERSRGRWSVTDFAVVLLALGVFSLSTVGYFVLLR